MPQPALAQLAPDLLVEVLSCITHTSTQLAWFSALCRPVSATLTQDAAWRHLCRRYWYATEDRIKEWPSLSPKGLYRALEQWAPLEGYYVLAPAFPWGLLVLLRITDGRVLADVIRFVSRADGTFDEVPVPLFRVTLHEERPGIVRSVLDAPWSGGAEGQLSSLDPLQLRSGLPVGERFASLSIVEAGLFSTRRAVRVTASAEITADAAAAPGRSEGGEGSDARHWAPATPFQAPEQAKEETEGMLQYLLGEKAVPCDLALIRSPAEFCPQDVSFPGIRPGLYVGDYGHSFYGQFRTEVLLLEYMTFEAESLLEEAGRTIFARPRGEPAPRELGLLADMDCPVTFTRGVKQCGDIHVCMGATTFVAVCGPPEACSKLAAGRTAPPAVMNRQLGRQEPVRRAWRGFGTLATPGFGDPSWAGGWLVQLEDVAASGSNRFGFNWDRDQEAVVLQWVATQDTSPFLQREWLPEDLQ